MLTSSGHQKAPDSCSSRSSVSHLTTRYQCTLLLPPLAMPPTVLNYYQNYPGVWQPPQSDLVELGIDQQIVPPGATVRLYETARSGFVTLWPVGGELTVAGDVEVFVRIDFANNTYTYLSAPLTTPVDFANVSNLRLGIVAPVGPVGTSGPITEVGYRIVANAHLIYEVL